MFYLLITILLNALIFVLFKLFPRYQVDTLQAIVVNYFVCVITGSLFIGSFPIGPGSIDHPWFPWSSLMGSVFIFIFFLIGYTTKKEGITTTTIANKLSLVIPVLLSILLYHESASFGKIAGILLAFPAIYFISYNAEKNEPIKKHLWLPVLLFFISGFLDALVKWVEHNYLSLKEVQAVYTIHVFATAALIGACILLVKYFIKGSRLQLKNIIAGIVLGIPNFFSIYFFIRLLNDDFMQSSATIPLNNISIVAVSVLAAVLLFKERMSPKRLLGLGLSILSILLIALAETHD